MIEQDFYGKDPSPWPSNTCNTLLVLYVNSKLTLNKDRGGLTSDTTTQAELVISADAHWA